MPFRSPEDRAGEQSMQNNRRQYRAKPGPDLQVDVAVIGDRNRMHAASIVDVSGGGIRLDLHKRMDPLPALGSVLHVMLSASELPEPIDAPAAVVQVDDLDGHQQLGLRFLDWLGLAAAIPARLAPLFNLRSDPRLDLDPATQVEVTVRGLDVMFELQGSLRNVSRGGLSFSAPPVAECALCRTDLCAVEFRLPGSTRMLSLAGRIRHRALLGEAVHYGICFDPQYTQHFTDQQRFLEDYVQKRLRAALRQLSTSAS